MSRKQTERPVGVVDHCSGPIDQFTEGKKKRFAVLRGQHRDTRVLQTLEEPIRRQPTTGGDETEVRFTEETKVLLAIRGDEIGLIGEFDANVPLIVEVTKEGSMVLDIGVALAFEGEKERTSLSLAIDEQRRVIRVEERKGQVRGAVVAERGETGRGEKRTRWKTKVKRAMVRRPRSWKKATLLGSGRGESLPV